MAGELISSCFFLQAVKQTTIQIRTRGIFLIMKFFTADLHKDNNDFCLAPVEVESLPQAAWNKQREQRNLIWKRIRFKHIYPWSLKIVFIRYLHGTVMRIIYLFLLFAALPFHSLASNDANLDWVLLKSGYAFRGDVIKFKHCELIMKVEGQRLVIPADSIYYLEFQNPLDNVAVNMQKFELNNCVKGKFDAPLHGRGFGNGCLGFFFGVFGVIGTALGNAKPIRGMRARLSKNQDLFNDPEYMKCYRRRQRGRAVGASLTGWALFIIAYSAWVNSQ